MLFIANLKNNAFKTDISLILLHIFLSQKERISQLFNINRLSFSESHRKKINSSNVFFFSND